jgi:presequence protease
MFTLTGTTSFPSRRLVAKRYRHDCGLEVLSLEANDPENLFCLCFSTDAVDDTGAAHVVEHSVLEGSERFPVKDPFVCLLKTSVATFLNACTYSDRTLYPFITCCPQDYFNLLEVYWDAAFHPLLTPHILGQEGWHYEISREKSGSRLTINGIVHNEMSGYYSSPTTVLGRMLEKSLFPDTPLRYDSGGVPDKIPGLTYGKFLNFHHGHYHPSVAKVVLYGNIPTEEKLAVLEKHLEHDLAVLPPPPKPKKSAGIRAAARPTKPAVRRAYFTPDASSRKNCTGLVSVAWALDDTRDMDLDLGFQLMESVLLGNAAAPLSKALMESGIGAAPLSSGYDNETRYTSFCVGMRGVKPKDFPAFEHLVLDTLRSCVEKGLPRDQVEGVITGFQAKNQNITSDYVYDTLEDVMAAWQYGDDPFLFLKQADELPHLQERLNANPRYVEDLIQKWLLDNPRRVRLELRPDNNLKERQDKKLAERLSARIAKWSPSKRAKVEKFQEELKQKALQEDTPEALATIPELHRTDLPEKITPFLCQDGVLPNGAPVRRSTDITNGLSTLKFALDTTTLPVELIPYLKSFTTLAKKLGTTQHTYDQVAERWNLLGASFQLDTSLYTPAWGEPIPHQLVSVSVRALDRHFPRALEFLREQLLEGSFTERKHLKELLRGMAAKLFSTLLGRENSTLAYARAGEGLSAIGNYSSWTGGLAIYDQIAKLSKASDKELDAFCEKLSAIARWLASAPLVGAGVSTEDDGAWRAIGEFTSLWKGATAAGDASILLAAAPAGLSNGRREYGVVPAKVHTCVRTFPAPYATHPDAIPLSLGGNILSSGFLWDEIRAKGGAYGCTLKYRSDIGMAYLHAHDDPNCAKTYQTYDRIAEYLRKNPFTQQQVDHSILQCLGAYLTPFRPSDAASQCLGSLMKGTTNQRRQEQFDKTQKTTAAQVQDAILRLLEDAPHNDCALGPAPIPEGMSTLRIPSA